MTKYDQEESNTTTKKRIVFIRHGQTFMNEFIDGINYGGPNFTDIFPDTPEYRKKYYDSPLSPTGINQAQELHNKLKNLMNGKEDAAQQLSISPEDAAILQSLELILVSPLTRALQTLDIGLFKTLSNEIPILAIPLATERVYLVSDIGTSRSELKTKYPYIDFDTAFDTNDDSNWYYTPTEQETQNYVEWRPSGQGQKYACLGEPQEHFDRRMSQLYRYLESCSESTIAVVCHAGVIDWFVQEIFENCQVGVIPFEKLKPRGLVKEELNQE